MGEFLIALLLLLVPIYLFTKLNGKWKNRIKYTFWLTVWVYPVLYLIYYFNPGTFWPFIFVVLITLTIAVISFLVEGGFSKQKRNSNIGRKFNDIF